MLKRLIVLLLTVNVLAHAIPVILVDGRWAQLVINFTRSTLEWLCQLPRFITPPLVDEILVGWLRAMPVMTRDYYTHNTGEWLLKSWAVWMGLMVLASLYAIIIIAILALLKYGFGFLSSIPGVDLGSFWAIGGGGDSTSLGHRTGSATIVREATNKYDVLLQLSQTAGRLILLGVTFGFIIPFIHNNFVDPNGEPISMGFALFDAIGAAFTSGGNLIERLLLLILALLQLLLFFLVLGALFAIPLFAPNYTTRKSVDPDTNWRAVDFKLAGVLFSIETALLAIGLYFFPLGLS